MMTPPSSKSAKSSKGGSSKGGSSGTTPIKEGEKGIRKMKSTQRERSTKKARDEVEDPSEEV